MLLRSLVVLVLLAPAAISRDARAGCADPRDVALVQRAIQRELVCGRKRMAGQDVVCGSEEVPACGVTSLAEVRELVFGGAPEPVDTETFEREWACQSTIIKAAASYVRHRSKELQVLGRRGSRDRLAQKLSRRCVGLTAGDLPRIGGECASLVAAGDPFDDERVTACLRASLERITQDVISVAVRPNIVLVLTDDQRADMLDAMPRVREQLVDRGLELTNGFATTSLCSPGRASILTGLYAHNHGVRTNSGALEFDASDTIAVRLQDAGYTTALIGKYMNNTGIVLGRSIPPGWDEWRVFQDDEDLYYDYQLNENGVIRYYGHGPEDYSTDVLAVFAERFIEANSERPFLLVYAPFGPHTVAIPAPRHEGAFQSLPPWRPPSWQEPDISDKPDWLAVIRFFVASSPEAVPETDQRRIDQLETLLAVDEAVADLATTLEEHGLSDNTLVVFTSDNGFMWLEHWLRLKSFPYEESIRVPLVARYPLLVPAARATDELVLNVDLAPTFAELAGVTDLPATNGRSLVPLFRGDGSGWRDDILIEHFGTASAAPHAGVRTARWKYIETEASGGVTEELYDLENDPYELENVAADPGNEPVLADLATRLAELRAE